MRQLTMAIAVAFVMLSAHAYPTKPPITPPACGKVCIHGVRTA
jgi:hypothetical protein